MEEAIARGQLPLVSGNSRGTKRRHEEGPEPQRNNKRPHQTTVRQEKKFSLPRPNSLEASNHGIATSRSLPPSPKNIAAPVTGSMVQYPESDDSDSDDNGPPEVISSKQPGERNQSDLPDETEQRPTKTFEPRRPTKPSAKASLRQMKKPKLPPRNPFASRPTLLRNVSIYQLYVASCLQSF
jgi:hypothetical protein